MANATRVAAQAAAAQDGAAASAGLRSERTAHANQIDHTAGLAWRTGDLSRAAHLIQVAMELDPGRGDHWQQRRAVINQSAGEEICPGRPGLAAQTAARLVAAGITPDDPGLASIRAWNAAVLARNTEAEAEAGA